MRFLALLVCLHISAQAFSNDNGSLKFGHPKGNVYAVPLSKILTQAYSNLNMEIITTPILGRRSLLLSNSGQLDGELIRAPIVARDYKNLIQIPTPLYRFEAYAYAIEPIPNIHSWNDLRDYKVGHLIGVVLYEEHTKHMDRQLSHNYDALLSILTRGAIDIAVMERYHFLTRAKSGFHQSPTPLNTGHVFHYLHKSHAEIVPLVNAEIAKMTQTGEVSKIIEQYFTEATSSLEQ